MPSDKHGSSGKIPGGRETFDKKGPPAFAGGYNQKKPVSMRRSNRFLDSRRFHKWMKRSMRVFRSIVSNQTGFTVTELITTVTVIGILAAVAMPTFFNMLPGLRLSDAARQVAIDLQQIRMKAIAQNIPYQIAFSTSTYVLQKCNGACTNDSSDITLPEGITVSASAAPQFQPRGTAAASATITLSNGSAQKWVCVKAVGRVNIQAAACS